MKAIYSGIKKNPFLFVATSGALLVSGLIVSMNQAPEEGKSSSLMNELPLSLGFASYLVSQLGLAMMNFGFFDDLHPIIGDAYHHVF